MLLFPPVHGTDLQSAAAQVQAVCYRSPLLYELPRSRWSLALLRKAVAWLADKSLSCISQLLKRMHVSYKRGRLAVHSPDLLYDVKLARIRAAYQQMQQDPTHVVLLYLDEHLVGRYPTVARCYSSTGAPGMQARQSKFQLLFQPTYAPWTNPMGKVWLRFNEDVSHMHPHWAKWQPWRLRIDDWIAQVRPPSQAMLLATGVASLSYLASPAIIHFNL